MAFGSESGGASETAWTRQDTVQTPHWMKLLEERYQRLHAKIVNQAARFPVKRHSNLSLKGPTARCVKESRQTTKLTVASQENSEARGDFNQNLLVDEVCAEETNEAENSDPIRSPNVNVNAAFRSLTGAGKSGHINKAVCKSQRKSSGDRAVPLTNCFENDISVSAQETPRTSGVVTRVSSALALTRLSSECDIQVNTNSLNSRNVAPAAELRLALQTQLGTVDDDGNDEIFEGNDDERHFLRLNNNDIFERENVDAEIEKRFGIDIDECDNDSVRCHTAREEMEATKARRRRRPHRSVKTSISRVSNKTSKSCPASFWENGFMASPTIIHDNNNNHVSPHHSKSQDHVTGTLLSLTAQGVQEGRMRVFARMSLEARHAIDETLKEMKGEDESAHNCNTPEGTHLHDSIWPNGTPKQREDSRDLRSMVNNPSEQGPDISAVRTHQDQVDAEDDNRSVDAESDVSLPSSNLDVYAPPPNRSGLKSQHLHNSTLYNQNPPSPRRSLNGPMKATNRRLPHLDHSAAPPSARLPNPHARLPGIGTNQASLNFRENTFEITPPDFDIRFHQIITCQTGDRETPPLDVRQQAIEKCQQWLVRQTPRH